MIKIDKNIPPPLLRQKSKKNSDIFEAMLKLKVDESFFTSKHSDGIISSLIYRDVKILKPKCKFIRKKVIERGKTGIRVWRIK